MKTSKITRTFVFVLGAIAAAGSAEGADFSQITNIPRDATAYVAKDQTVTLKAVVTLTATAAGAATPGVGGWISVSDGAAGAPTFPTYPWNTDANTGRIEFDGGTIAAHGGFANSGDGTIYTPFIPGIRTGIELDSVDLPTSWSVAGGNCVTGAVSQDFDGATGALTSGIIAAAANTVTMELAEATHHLAANRLYSAPEIALPTGDVKANFTCRRATAAVAGRIAPFSLEDASTEWEAGTTTRLDAHDDYLEVTGVDIGITDTLTTDEIDAYQAALAIRPIRARATLGTGGTTTLSGSWAGFQGSHFVVDGAATGKLAVSANATSLPQSDITVLQGELELGAASYTTGADSVVDLRGCSKVSGGTLLTLGARSKLIF
jgi:hypothetical protein